MVCMGFDGTVAVPAGDDSLDVHTYVRCSCYIILYYIEVWALCEGAYRSGPAYICICPLSVPVAS